MMGYKELLKSMALRPFHPLYNLGDSTYSLTSEGSFTAKRVGKLEEKQIAELEHPFFIEISKENFKVFVGTLDDSELGNKNLFERVMSQGNLLLSYLVSIPLGRELDCWWIDTLLEDLGQSLSLEFLLNLQKEYRDILMEISPDLKVYIPYHWVELALLTSIAEEQGLEFSESLLLDSSISGDVRVVLSSEYNNFLESLKDKRLSKVHSEYIMKHLLLIYTSGELKFGHPFPFDTKGKKVEKVSIKVINMPSL